MYKEAYKKADAKHLEKKKVMEIIHHSNRDKRTTCNKAITPFMGFNSDKSLVTCSVCRKLLGLPLLSFSDGIREVSSLEIGLQAKIDSMKAQIKTLQEQISLTKMFLEAEVEKSKLKAELC